MRLIRDYILLFFRHSKNDWINFSSQNTLTPRKNNVQVDASDASILSLGFTTTTTTTTTNNNNNNKSNNNSALTGTFRALVSSNCCRKASEF